MRCKGCDRETMSTPWGDWCTPCGGVMVDSAPEFNSNGIIIKKNPARLFFRHVVTAVGPGGVFPIIYDLSAEQYGVAWPRKITTVRCIHCGLDTPSDDDRKGLALLDEHDGRRQTFQSARGSLDAMIARIQPIVSEGTGAYPTLSPAPSATPEERALIGAVD